ncbi:MAG: iron-containing alcohol dehydrogenase [Anaerovoracaceae bacterium]|jgi:alcohol dehydrogenase YqhD (iron-dependent ADH family)
MQNFSYETPTRLIFGKGAVEKLPGVMKPLGNRILLTYGGGSIHRSGLYDKVKELLKDFTIFELSGIEPNPKYTTSVVPGVELCKKESIDVILAVGGGSVIDCSKAIAAGAKYNGEPWDLITYKAKTTGALPLVDILTLAAAGSEFDSGCVISRTETNDKVGYGSRFLYPVCSLMDPEYTFTVPPMQTAAGCADAMNHTIEQYFTADTTLLNDGICEANLRSLMANTKILMKDPENYTARAEFMLDCSYGCNGILALGNSYSGWPCHGMEHALSAYYDITHGVGLAIITPRWMEHILSDKTLPRFVKFAKNAMEVEPGADDMETARRGIDALYRFFESIGLPMHLKDVGIDGSCIGEMAHHVAENEGLDEAYVPLTEQDIADIFTASL